MMCSGYTQQICLMNRLRQLWVQHVYWTRFFIISTAANLGDLKPVTERLLRNPKDFAHLFASVFGKKAACRFQELFTQHLLSCVILIHGLSTASMHSFFDRAAIPLPINAR